MAAPVNKRSGLLTQAHELVKQHIEYDGSGRMEYVYTASNDAPDGAQCTRVQYTYHATYSNNVENMEETYSTWDSDWDVS